MVGLSHVILHLGLCGSMSRVSPQTTLATHVRLFDRLGRPQIDQTYKIPREEGAQKVVQFDLPRGVYFMQIDAPKYKCSTSDFLSILPDRDRTVNETLADAAPLQQVPLLLQGTAPTSFLYTKPTFVIFDKSVACGKPVNDPLPSRISVENDADAYYTWVYTDPATQARMGTLALSLQTPSGDHHYIRVPLPAAFTATRWPSSIDFDVTEDMLDGMASDPVETLLCPKLRRTSVG